MKNNSKRSETSYSIINPRTVLRAKPTPTQDQWQDPSFLSGLHEWCDVEATLDLMFPDTRMPLP